MSRYPQNTYVGMRYVPLFDGDWNSEKDYEPLTVVNMEGNSYTSKTFVPAGVNPVGNIDYWAESGNYNAQIEAYRQEVLQYNERIQTNADAIAALDAKEDSDVKILEGKINTKKADVFSGKIVCIGDSYLQGYTPDGTVESWGEKIKKIYPNTVIKAEGGAGFHNVGQNGNTFKGLIDNMSVDDSVTLVLIGGCYNDSISTALTRIEVYNTFKSAFAKFPNAKVYAINMGVGTKLNPYGKYNTSWCLTQVCASYNKCLTMDITNFLKSSYSNNFASDGIHPNNMGQEIIANSIINILHGNENKSILGRTTLTGTLSENVSATIKDFVFENCGDVTFLRFYKSVYVQFVDTPVSKDNWCAEEICKITIPYDRGKCASAKFLSVPFVNAYVHRVDTNDYVPANVWMESTDEPDVWSIKATILNGNGFYDGAISSFSIESIEQALPTIAL